MTRALFSLAYLLFFGTTIVLGGTNETPTGNSVKYPSFGETDEADLSAIKAQVEDLRSKVPSSQRGLKGVKAEIANAIILYNKGRDGEAQLEKINKLLLTEDGGSMVYVVLRHLNVDSRTFPFFKNYAKSKSENVLRVSAINRLGQKVDETNSDIKLYLIAMLNDPEEDSAIRQKIAEIIVAHGGADDLLPVFKYAQSDKNRNDSIVYFMQKYFPKKYDHFLTLNKQMFSE